MDLTDFYGSYLNNLIESFSKEQMSIFPPRDFNVDLLNYNKHNPNNEF